MSQQRRGFFCLPSISSWFSPSPARANPAQPTTTIQQTATPMLSTFEDTCKDARVKNKVRVSTQIPKEAIFCQDEFDPCDYYRYCCPVCLRYFNHILVSSCCQNYLCRQCASLMVKRAKQVFDYKCRCVHCMSDNFTLNDVDHSKLPREYTDSPGKYRVKVNRPITPTRFSTDSESRPNLATPSQSTRSLTTKLKIVERTPLTQRD